MTRESRHEAGSLYAPSGERKYLTPTERERFLAFAWSCQRPDLRTLALVLALTGCRISEALALRAGAVQRETGCIALRSLKRRHGAIIIREVPVPARLLDELERVHGISSAHPSATLWTLSRSRAWSLIKTLMAQAEIAAGIHQTPKGLRHAYGLHAIRNGVPLNLLQKWLGHAKLSTTAIYAQAMGDEEREIASRMWRGDNAAPAPFACQQHAFFHQPLYDAMMRSGLGASNGWPLPTVPSLDPRSLDAPLLISPHMLAKGRWRWVLVQIT